MKRYTWQLQRRDPNGKSWWVVDAVFCAYKETAVCDFVTIHPRLFRNGKLTAKNFRIVRSQR